MLRCPVRFAIALLCLVSGTSAHGQATNAGPGGGSGTGMTFGVALGVSRVSLSRVATTGAVRAVDLGLGWHVGYQVSSRLSALLVGSAAVYPFAGAGRARKRSFESLVPSLEYRVDDRLRLSAGVGLQLDAPVFYDVRANGDDERRFSRGIGAVLGMSYAVRRRGSFTPDVRARVTTGYANVPSGHQTGTSAAVLVGMRRDPVSR